MTSSYLSSLYSLQVIYIATPPPLFFLLTVLSPWYKFIFLSSAFHCLDMWHFDTCHVRFGSLPHLLPVYRLAAEGASHWKSQVTQTHWNHKIQQSIKLFLRIRPVLSAAEKHIQTVFYPDTNPCKRNGYLIFGKGNFYHQKAKRTKRQILDTPVGHKWVFWRWSFLLNLLKIFTTFSGQKRI